MALSHEDRELLGLGFWAVLEQLHHLRRNQMALADTLAQLTQENTDIKADVDALIALQQTENAQITDLQAQIAALQAGSVTPEQLTALQAAADGLAATHAEAQAALPAPAPPADTPPA